MFFHFVVWMLPISELIVRTTVSTLVSHDLFTRRYYFNIFHNQ